MDEINRLCDELDLILGRILEQEGLLMPKNTRELVRGRGILVELRAKMFARLKTRVE